MTIYTRPIQPSQRESSFGSRFHRRVNEISEGHYLYTEMRPELERLIMQPEPVFDSAEAITAHFPAIIQSSVGVMGAFDPGDLPEGDWPKEYGWAEAELDGDGSSYSILEGGRNSNDDGLAINRVELIPGFGDTVGPNGQPLVNAGSTLTVLPIEIGSPVEMIFERNSSDKLIPVFSAYNPMTVECNL